MWFKKASPRRQAIREDLAEIRLVDPSRGRKRQLFLVMLVFGLLAACLQFWPRNPMPYRIREKAPMDLRAVHDFYFVDPVKLAEARELARLNTEKVLSVDEATLDQVASQLNTLRGNVGIAHSLAELPAESRRHFPSLNEERFNALKQIDPHDFSMSVSTFKELTPHNGLRDVYLVSPDDEAVTAKRRTDVAVEAPSDSQVLLTPTNSIDVKWPLPQVRIDRLLKFDEHGMAPAARGEVRDVVSKSGEFVEPLVDVVTDEIMSLTRPIYRYDARLSALLVEQRVPRYMPEPPYFKNGTILVERDREIDATSLQKLIQSQEALELEIAASHPWIPWLNRLGLVAATFLLVGAGAFYASRAVPSITIRRAWAIAGLLWITMAAAKVIAVWPIGLMAIAPTLLVAIILVIAENPRFALGMAALHGLLVTFTVRQGLDFYIPLLAGTAIFCFGLREIRTRGKLIEVGAAAGIGIFTAVWAVGASRLMGLAWSRWIGSTDISVTSTDALWGAGAGVAVAMFALAILPSIERIFKITTSMTLLELCDANKPLLRRLSQEAPGTFNHSLTVGLMAESAGNAIGANGLLCRVGAYYHDVGKLSKPQYFIENQNPGHPNRHDKLSPAMSLLIIVGHVKDGIELAREYGLPWIIHQFIAQHHGTTLVEYFFHAARKRAEKDEDSMGVSETEFRYPGPRPQTPEAAIVMICDSCESVVRSIDEPTPGRIESAVHNMIMKRLLDGQFSECDLTLRDLSVIEETLVRTLAGVHHGRVSYPGRPEEGPSDIGLSRPA